MTTEYTVTRDSSPVTGSQIIVHEDDHHSPPVATFTGMEGEELFELLLAGSRDTLTFWDANRAAYL